MRTLTLAAVSILACCPALAQTSPKESAQVWLGINLQIYANNASAASIYYVTMEDSVNPLGYLPMYNISPAIPHDPTEAPIQAAPIFQKVTPGHLYYINFSCGAVNYADFLFNAPPGYTVYVGQNGYPLLPRKTIPTPNYGGGGNSPGYEVFFYVVPNDGAAWLSPGFALPPKVSDVRWAVSAGSLASGLSAGTLRWRSTTVAQTLLDAASLFYTPTTQTANAI